MLRSSSSRGQTEPLGALVAVIALTVGVAIYGVYVTEALPGSSERTIEEPTLDQVRQEIEEDGVFRDDEHDDLGGEIGTEALPQGQNVYVEVTYVDDGGEETVAGDAFFGTDGQPDREPIRTGELDEPPVEAGVAEEPIAVATRPGDVRGGTLRVGVWSG